MNTIKHFYALNLYCRIIENHFVVEYYWMIVNNGAFNLPLSDERFG